MLPPAVSSITVMDIKKTSCTKEINSNVKNYCNNYQSVTVLRQLICSPNHL